MSADADPRCDLPALAKLAAGRMRSVEQRHLQTAGEIHRTISDHHRRVDDIRFRREKISHRNLKQC